MSDVPTAREIWAMGDFPKVARDTVRTTGAQLVAACGIGPGQRVLDVAAGAGNVARPAARTGASVVASDITPELLAAGRAEAEAEGLRLEWVEADAQALPFEDGSFDVVVSSFGAMFAPDHRRTAGELARVCRPGGTIGLASWTPASWPAEMMRTLAEFGPPPPPGFEPPTLWGDEQHLREIFGDRLAALRAEPHTVVVDHVATPEEALAYYGTNFGPIVATRAALAAEPERLAAYDAAFLDFATRTNGGPEGGPVRYELEYLLVVGQRAA